MNWLELRVAVDHESVEAVSEVLSQYGYNGGVVIDMPWKATKESDGWIGTPHDQDGADAPPLYTVDPNVPVTLRTYLHQDNQAEDVRQRIEQALWHLGQLRPVGPLEVRELQEEDWANEWRKYYQIQRIGKRVVIVPSWLEHAPSPEDIVLHLDPGMAFGTGLHPTTQLCLRLLERFVPFAEDTSASSPEHMPGGFVAVRRPSLLDIGTGSGILAIAAAKLGAERVLALDNDPIAVNVASENVQRNGVSERVQVELGSLGKAEKRQAGVFDMVVANIIADVIIALARDLADALTSGGVLISSGIVQEREEEVVSALDATGLNMWERHIEGDWVAFVHGRVL